MLYEIFVTPKMGYLTLSLTLQPSNGRPL